MLRWLRSNVLETACPQAVRVKDEAPPRACLGDGLPTGRGSGRPGSTRETRVLPRDHAC